MKNMAIYAKLKEVLVKEADDVSVFRRDMMKDLMLRKSFQGFD